MYEWICVCVWRIIMMEGSISSNCFTLIFCVCYLNLCHVDHFFWKRIQINWSNAAGEKTQFLFVWIDKNIQSWYNIHINYDSILNGGFLNESSTNL